MTTSNLPSRLLATALTLTLTTRTNADCATDLATFQKNGITSPAYSPDYSFCVNTGILITCDYFAERNAAGYARGCAIEGGDVVNIVTDITCSDRESVKVYVPLCYPRTCEAEDMIAGRRVEERAKAEFEECGVSVEELDLCRHQGVLEHPSFTGLEDWCEIEIDGAAGAFTCDFYQMPDMDAQVAECTDAGSTSISVTETEICTDDYDRTTTGPYCVPSGCDMNAILAQRQVEKQASAGPTCTVSITSPDVTPFPTLSPTTSPSKSSSPTERPSSTPSESLFPTLTRVTCKNRDFLQGDLCPELNATFADLGLTFQLSDDSVCEDIDGTAYCDTYQSPTIDAFLQKCEENGGDSVSVTRTNQCDKQTVIAPLCVPKGCETTTFLQDFYAAQREGIDASCNLELSDTSATDLQYCPETCIDRSTLDKEECTQKRYRLEAQKQFYDMQADGESCTVTSGNGTTLTDCNLYQKVAQYENMERCSVRGGDNVRVQYMHKCPYAKVLVVVKKLAPMCVPRNCDGYDFLREMRDLLQHRKDNWEVVRCYVTLEYDLEKDLDYCDVPEIEEVPTLPKQCIQDLEVMRRAGNAPSIDDGYQKFCATSIKNGAKTTRCKYHDGEQDAVLANCTNTPDTTVVRTTTSRQCQLYGADTLTVLPNLMCVPNSCSAADVTKLAIREEIKNQGPGCTISSEEGFWFTDPPTEPPVAAPTAVSGLSPGDSPVDTRGATSVASLFGCHVGFVLLGMVSLYLGY